MSLLVVILVIVVTGRQFLAQAWCLPFSLLRWVSRMGKVSGDFF
jgi:hypothetical protein